MRSQLVSTLCNYLVIGDKWNAISWSISVSIIINMNSKLLHAHFHTKKHIQYFSLRAFESSYLWLRNNNPFNSVTLIFNYFVQLFFRYESFSHLVLVDFVMVGSVWSWVLHCFGIWGRAGRKFKINNFWFNYQLL